MSRDFEVIAELVREANIEIACSLRIWVIDTWKRGLTRQNI